MSNVNKEKDMQATNLVNGKRVPVMHGENWFMPVDKLVGVGRGKTVKHFIAGHSETGHHHIIESDIAFKVYEPVKGDRAILLEEVSKLYHNKSFDIHETQYLAPGAYKIYHKQEYDPFRDVVRNVYD